MRRFAIKLALFLAANAAAAAVALAFIDARYGFAQFETDSILLSMPREENVGLLIMGTSRARLLTRVKCNLESLELATGLSTFNIAVPFGGGIVPSKMYLEQFYRRGNSADTILFFLDLFTMYSHQYNRDHRFVYYEPLRPSFLLAMVRNDIPIRRVFIYIQSKFSGRWISQTPLPVHCEYHVIEAPDPEIARLREESLYPDGVDNEIFAHYAKTLIDILEMAKKDGANVIIAFPPTMLGPQPGSEHLLGLLEQVKADYPVEFHDFTDVITDTALFLDYDHINSYGVELFVEQHLAPILRQKPHSP